MPRLAGFPRGLAIVAAAVVAALAAQVALTRLAAAGHVTNYVLLILSYVGINVILAASLNLVNGVAGQFSIGHAGFMCVGAYASAAVTLGLKGYLAQAPPFVGQAVFFASLLFGGLLAAGAGYLVGLPSLRL